MAETTAPDFFFRPYRFSQSGRLIRPDLDRVSKNSPPSRASYPILFSKASRRRLPRFLGRLACDD